MKTNFGWNPRKAESEEKCVYPTLVSMLPVLLWAGLGWAGLGWARGVTKMFSQFLVRLRVTPAPAPAPAPAPSSQFLRFNHGEEKW